MNTTDTGLSGQTTTTGVTSVPPFPQTPTGNLPSLNDQSVTSPVSPAVPPFSPQSMTPQMPQQNTANIAGGFSQTAQSQLESTPMFTQQNSPAIPTIQQVPPAVIPAAPVIGVNSIPTPTIPTQPVVPQPVNQDFKPEHEAKSKLPLLIAGILLILAIAGGYFLYTLYQMPVTSEEEPTVPVVTTAPTPTLTDEQQGQQDVESLNAVSPSDEVESIETDVNNTNLTDIDSGLQ